MKKVVKVIGLLVIVSLMMSLFFTACGSEKQNTQTTQSTTVAETEKVEKLKIGYVANFLGHEFYQRVIEGMKEQAAQMNVELVVADSNSDVNTQNNNIESYIAQKLNAIVLSPIDPAAVQGSVAKAKAAGIPTITESNAVEGAVTMVGAVWYESGRNMGKWMGEYVKSKGITGKVLIVGFPSFQDCVNIEKGFTEVMKELVPDIQIVSIDGQAVKEKAFIAASDAITANPEINLIMGINDDSTLGGVQAYKAAGKDMSKLVSITQGLEGNAGCTAMAEEKSLTAAYALFPEVYGQNMLKAAVEAANKKELPQLYKSPMCIVTLDNLSTFYKKDGENYKIDYSAAKDIK